MRAIAIPFRFTGEVVAETTHYPDVVRGQVIDALMTNRGERAFRPRYGCDIQSTLFDPRDELVRVDAASIIKNRLSQMVPRCVVTSVSVVAPGASTELFIKVGYKPSLLAQEVEVSVPVSSSEFYARSTSELGAANAIN